MNELGVQKHLCDAIHALGGVAWKNNNQFIAGVPDLHVHLDPYPTAQIEVKFVKAPPKRGTIILTKDNYITPKQRVFMERMQRAHDPCGVVIAFYFGAGNFTLIASNELWPYGKELPFANVTPNVLTKTYGGAWPVREMMALIFPEEAKALTEGTSPLR